MPTDNIFNDEYMNDMLLNPNLYDLENNVEIENTDMKDDKK